MGVFLLQPVDDSDKSSSSTDPALMPVKKALFALQSEKSFQQLDKEQQLEKTVALLEQLPPEYKRLKRQYQIALSSVPDILFYGRVIDQHGAPVVNAAVYYTGTNNYLAAGAGRCPLYTSQSASYILYVALRGCTTHVKQQDFKFDPNDRLRSLYSQ